MSGSFPRTASSRRSLVLGVAILTVLAGLTLAVPQVGLAADPTLDPAAAAEAQRLEAYWTGDRMRAAIPRDRLVASPPDDGAPVRVAPAAAGDVDGASWTGGGPVVTRSGQVFFSIDGGDYGCSASAIRDDGDTGYSLVLSAAHCVFDGGFADNWVYVPAFDRTPNANGCSQTTYGCWGARALVVHQGWVDGFPEADYAIAVVGPGGKSGTQLDALGTYPLRIGGVDVGDRVHAFGYPANPPYSGLDLTYCVGSAETNVYGDWGLLCDMKGGSSGGPWLWGAGDTKAGCGEVFAVTSYGFASDPTRLFAPQLDAHTQAVYNAALEQTPAAGDQDGIVAVGTDTPPTPADPASPFTDICNSSFIGDIEWLFLNGITTGCSALAYCPSGNVTREQMAGFMVRAFDLPASGTNWFTDDETSTFEDDINALRAAGITLGCAPGKYCPKAEVTREQMAGFLVRALDLPTTTTDYFTDDGTSTFEDEINALRAAGVTTGCAPGKFCPKSFVTREQMAGFLHRALD